jgi:GAF domain
MTEATAPNGRPQATAQAAKRRRLGWVMVVLTILAIAFEAPAAMRPFFPPLVYGWTLDSVGTVQTVWPGDAAERAGVRPGDRVESHGFTERYRLDFPRAGNVAVVHRGTRTFRVAASANRLEFNYTWFAALSDFLSLPLIAFAGFLCWRRPGLMTIAFWLFAIGQVGGFDIEGVYARLPDPFAGILHVLLVAVIGTWEFYPLLIFALRFPYDRLDRPWERVFERIWIGVSIAELVYVATQCFSIEGGLAYTIAQNAALPLVLAAFIWRYLASDAETRRRAAWAIVGIAISAGAGTLGNLLFEFGYEMGLGAGFLAVANCSTIISALGPYALVYATLRHRLLDVSFVLNRTVVFGALAALVVVVVGAIDWGVGKLLSNTRAAIAIEAAATIALGFVLDRVHAVLERAVDRFVFARRHAAERYLERVIAGLSYAETRGAVLDALVEEPRRAFRLSSAAAFIADGGFFRRECAWGWRDAELPQIDGDDPLVRLLRSERTVIDVDDARWQNGVALDAAARPEIAVPLLLRDELLGIAFYGHRDDATTLDPEERRLLRRLADAAAGAYEAVDAKEAKRMLAEANAKLTSLGLAVAEGDPARA